MDDGSQFDAASDVFVGRILETHWIPENGAEADVALGGHVEAKVEVLERLKGTGAKVVTVTSGVFNDSNCAYPLIAGAQFVFFLSSETEVSACGGVRLFRFTVGDRQKRIDELRKLGVIAQPKKP